MFTSYGESMQSEQSANTSECFMKSRIKVFTAASCSLAILSASAADWPQFLGPTRDGVYSGGDIAEAWPKEGPPIIWKKRVGQGFSGPIVLGEKVILFHRVANEEVVDCLEADTGSTVWKHSYSATYRDDFGFDEGPRSTPAASDGKIYCFGANGVLHCLKQSSGEKVWSVDCRQQFSAPKGFFGMVCSPLIEGNLALINIGGANGSGIVAFDKDTGKLAWKATADEASYSSPVTATIHSSRYGLVFTRNGLVALNPATGNVFSNFPWKPPMSASVSAATPLVIDDFIFISASYGTGAALLRMTGDNLAEMWSSDNVLSNHYATSVYHNGYLYGFHGRQEHGPSLRCVELKTGKVMWNDDSLKAGTVTLAGSTLLLMIEDGRLIMAPASEKRFSVSARAQVLPSGVRAYPAVANGHFFARSKNQLACIDLSEGNP